MEPYLIASLMICPDGTILQSKHRHDYVEYTDKEGNYYMLDGGLDYVKYSDGKGRGILEFIYNIDRIEIIREHMYWGRNYNSKKELLPQTEWILLKYISDDHLDALLVYLKDKKFSDVFEKEKQYRDGNI